MINIISGTKKRTKLEVPQDGVRPTSALKREAIFSILESNAQKNSYEMYSKKCFIDIFAGSGSLGLEAISRGAEYCYFYEIDNSVIKTLENNCLKICTKKNFKIIQQNVINFIFNKVDYPVSAIFIDPPYSTNPFHGLLEKLIKSNLITKNTIIVIETKIKTSINVPRFFKIINSKIYGKTKISFFSSIS